MGSWAAARDRCRAARTRARGRAARGQHDEDTVFVYGSSQAQLDRAFPAIEAEMSELEIEPGEIVLEHWLDDEDRWDSEPRAGHRRGGDDRRRLRAVGGARPVPLAHEARELADRLEGEGYGVVRRWAFVIAGTATREEAEELAARLHGEVEPGGELVWETTPGNPFAIFGGLGGYDRRPEALRDGRRGVRVASELWCESQLAGGVTASTTCRGGTADRAARMHETLTQLPTTLEAPRRHRSRGPSGRGLGRRAVPAAGRGPGGRPRARDRDPPRARRSARRDGGRAARAVAGVARRTTRSCSGSSACSPRSRRGSPPAPSCAATRWTRSPGCSPS